MWNFLVQRSTLILLSSAFTFGSFACGNNEETASNPSPVLAASPTPTKSATKSSPTPAKPVTKAKPATKATPAKSATKAKPAKPATKATPAKPVTPANPGSYNDAVDVAAGALIISQSAVSREDWTLVASRWQQAINLIKGVPGNTAKQKLSQYQSFLAEAKLKSAPPPKKVQAGNTSPTFFSMPIKERRGGTPVVDVTFNGSRTFEMLFDTGATSTLITQTMAASLQLKPVGYMKATIANGDEVVLPLAGLNSMEADGRVLKKMAVAVAPASVGLLGQDFYEGYDIQIKENAIEFRKQSGS